MSNWEMNMNPTRVTVAFDETTAKKLDKIIFETKQYQTEKNRTAKNSKIKKMNQKYRRPNYG